MDEFTAANAAALPIVWGVTEIAKRVVGEDQPPWFRRILPLIPVIAAFGVAFIPGVGLAAAPLLAKVGFALSVGATAATGQQVVKKTILGDVRK